MKIDISAVSLIVGAACMLSAILHDPRGVFDESGIHRSYLPAALVSCAAIWLAASRALLKGRFVAESAVTVATLGAIGIGQYSAAAVVALLLLSGSRIEQIVALRASLAVQALDAFLPSKVEVRCGPQCRVVPRQQVLPGDIVVVRSGQRVAVDGLVVTGIASVSQAALTGEFVPVRKTEGDEVCAGSINESGYLEVLTIRNGEATALGQVQRLMSEAIERRAHLERLLDRYCRRFTPLASLAAIVLWLLQRDVNAAITLLIVFCPCVLLLATPTCLAAVVGCAARRGVLLKSGEAVERLSQVDTVVFDKTGTLTYGRPRLVNIVPCAGMDAETLLAWAATAERRSEHMLARAVMVAAEERGIVLGEVEEFWPSHGTGVTARVRGRDVFVGRFDGQPDVTPRRLEQVASLERSGYIVSAIVVDDALHGLLVFEDEVRPGAMHALAELKRLGYRVSLLSGDSTAASFRVGREMMFDEVHGDLLPADKLSMVARWQSLGRRVLYVGDGVNDGPALLAAHVGASMCTQATDVARRAAQVVLLSDDLERIPYVLALCEEAKRTVRTNVLFSLGVMLLGIAGTVSGLLKPVGGAFLHELATLPVLFNSLRLWKSGMARPAPPMRAIRAVGSKPQRFFVTRISTDRCTRHGPKRPGAQGGTSMRSAHDARRRTCGD